jgi:hypothetical protein
MVLDLNTKLLIGSSIALVIGVIIYWYYVSLWNYSVTIWHVVNNRMIKRVDRGRVMVDKHTGAEMMHFFSHKEKKFGKAPAEAIEVNSKGKKCVELYRLGKDQYLWRGNKILTEKVVDKNGMEKLKLFEEIQDFTDDDRRIIIEHERKKAELHNLRGKTWLEHLPVIAVYGFIIIMFVVIFLFWQNIWQPVKEQQALLLEQNKVMISAMKEMQNLIIVTRGGQIIPSSNLMNETVSYGVT